eukprot:scaffold304452_cov33-Tisochrysis_lutea.AAC.3
MLPAYISLPRLKCTPFATLTTQPTANKSVDANWFASRPACVQGSDHAATWRELSRGRLVNKSNTYCLAAPQFFAGPQPSRAVAPLPETENVRGCGVCEAARKCRGPLWAIVPPCTREGTTDHVDCRDAGNVPRIGMLAFGLAGWRRDCSAGLAAP